MSIIADVTGREILDSRGRPTVAATCVLEGGARASASVPSGASTGDAEAVELRDGDPTRYRGLGCRQAAAHIGGEIRQAIAGRVFGDQRELDGALIALDGTPGKARLGANAVLAVSLAFARAAAVERGVPLYSYFGDLLGHVPSRLPQLTINLFSGGKHAGAQLPIQDVLMVPVGCATIDDCLAGAFAVYQSAIALTARKYQVRALTADEGGLAPPCPTNEVMIEDAVESIRAARLQPGREMALAVDVASSHFYRGGLYHVGGTPLESPQMVDHLSGWLDRYPIVSLEDGLAQDDWSYWPALRNRAAGRALVVGDDLLCTNTARIRRAIETSAANALLVKVNQIGTLTEAADACLAARADGWHIIVSARSGETEDDWLADLAVGWGADQIKVGSITHSERLAKYNRLLDIEAATRWPLARLNVRA